MTEYVISRKFNLLREIKSLTQYRELFLAFSKRVIKLHYQTKWIGISWTLIQPLFISAMFYVVLRDRMGGDFSNYFLYIFSGLMFWDLFAGSLSLSANTYIENAGLVKRVYFPRFLLPFTSITAKLMDFLIMLPVFLIMLAYNSTVDNWLVFLGYTLLALFCTLLVTAGVCLAFSILMVRFRNLQSTLPFIIHVLFFSSSIMYDPKLLLDNEWLNRIFQLNPLTGIFYIFRLGVFNEIPQVGLIGFYISLSLVIFSVGFGVYTLENKTLPDKL